jgi:predicted ferric reductase
MFHGLDNTYRAHHNIGSMAFILLLLHPLFLTIRYFLISPNSAFEFLKPNILSPFRALGSIALFGMVVAMFVTLYLKVEYKKFILAQRVLLAEVIWVYLETELLVYKFTLPCLLEWHWLFMSIGQYFMAILLSFMAISSMKLENQAVFTR